MICQRVACGRGSLLARSRLSFRWCDTKKMAFKLLHPVAVPETADSPDSRPQSRQLTLRLNGPRPVGVPAKPPNRAPSDIKLYIGHLSNPIDALRQQLREHSADRIALLLREMIEERERELERWVAREEAWD